MVRNILKFWCLCIIQHNIEVITQENMKAMAVSQIWTTENDGDHITDSEYFKLKAEITGKLLLMEGVEFNVPLKNLIIFCRILRKLLLIVKVMLFWISQQIVLFLVQLEQQRLE